ncbi:hypothetical protein ONS95_005240 [Cadophora gregata]|uniref:uncharacterized protein n=1 Tax=Cadophora gregata TaxID=51156 RepID=UPI0026DBA717|nr:uncharacterized protein ONS95_011784 [Cadophora gregata]XP_058349185.1 uncharacterized protein ONS95_008461 [Cadophora gregata]XP_058352154.1 uncharacterized protein ONS95_005240 [Cadophora gregata]KAK0114938.1 hypothetical protein ONS96_013412 [Cadophora gregata f. sp. sojae]KAK0099545.1 hypothetical protein ONS95_011784 [Cadophora gregata]KAK0100121.1 hypothetical protein ONS95_008461 [Cadophora gregata]KAK0104979.1 hypothetical protein ONS95_005240 [Cadophora gregata]
MDLFKKARKQVKAAVKDVQQQVNQISSGTHQQPANTQLYGNNQQQFYAPLQQPPQKTQYLAYGQQAYPSPPPQHQYSSPTAAYGYPGQTQTQTGYQPQNQQQYFPPPQSYPPPPSTSSPAQTPGSAHRQPVPEYQPTYQQPPTQQPHQYPLYQDSNQPPTPLPTPASGYPPAAPQNVSGAHYFSSTAPEIPTAGPLDPTKPPSSDPVQQLEAQYRGLDIGGVAQSQNSQNGPHTNIPQQYQTSSAISPTSASPWKTKCPLFEEVLSDVVPFYELNTIVLQSHSMPVPPASIVLVCEYCFLTVLAPHPHLASCFTIRPKDERPADKTHPQISFERIGGCALAFPRIRSTVINQCIPQRSITPFVEYCRLDADLGACQGGSATGPYYTCKAIDSLAFCNSCYECFIVGTPFQRNFTKQHMPEPHMEWGCDLGYSGFCNRTLLADLNKARPDFAHVAAAMNKKLSFAPCAGEGNAMFPAGAGLSYAYRSVADNSGVFCSTCFYNDVAGTPAEKYFGYAFELEEPQKGTLCCDLASPFSKYAMTTARNATDFSLWLDPIQAHHSLPLCPSIAGTDEADMPSMGENWQTWYHFRDHPNIECCPRCYRTNVAVLEAKHLFVPITRELKPGMIRQCYLSPSKDMTVSESWDPMDYENTTFWRGNYIRNLLRYGHFAGNDFTVAITEIKKIAELPKPCGSELRRFKPVNGRKWFGHVAGDPNDPNDATLLMCEECHLYSVKGTPLESLLSNDLTHLTFDNPEGHRCSTWSKQCKRRLRTACETSNFASYAQYHHKREEVYARIWRSIEELKPLGELVKGHTARINAETQMNIQMGSIRLAQQLNAQQNAIISGVGGSVAEAAATDHGYRYGNSTVGMGYLTHSGASAAMAHHNAANSRYEPPLDLNVWRNAPLEQLTTEYQRRLDVHSQIQEEWKAID